MDRIVFAVTSLTALWAMVAALGWPVWYGLVGTCAVFLLGGLAMAGRFAWTARAGGILEDALLQELATAPAARRACNTFEAALAGCKAVLPRLRRPQALAQ